MTLTQHIAPYGDCAFLYRIQQGANVIDRAHHANTLADATRKLPCFIEAIAGIDSVAIRFDPASTKSASAHDAFARVIEDVPFSAAPAPAKKLTLPICYGGEYGPDLSELGEQCGLSPDEVIRLHTVTPVRVLMIGFAPGFAYLGENEERISAPRLSTPRIRVEPGSVGIAGRFTGVYPFASPGGWRIIGRTPGSLFDPDREEPFLLTPGAEISFEAIDEAAFKRLSP